MSTEQKSIEITKEQANLVQGMILDMRSLLRELYCGVSVIDNANSKYHDELVSLYNNIEEKLYQESEQ